MLSDGKWGGPVFGTEGGVVTWSIVGPGVNLSEVGYQTSFDPNTALTVDYVALLREAFADWSAISNIEFIQVEDDNRPAGIGTVGDIRIYFTPFSNFYAGFAYYPEPLSGPLAGDVFLNSGYPGIQFEPAFFKKLALHEIGHALGLGHIDQFITSIMNPRIEVTEIQPIDVGNIRSIYGAQDGTAPEYTMPAFQANLNVIDAPFDLTVNGNGLANTITGTDSADIIRGLAGADHLNGEGGNDIVAGGAGADMIDGGAGFNFADYRDAPGPLTIDLAAPSNSSTFFAEDTLVSIKGLFGAQAFSNTFVGDEGRTFFTGGDLSDTLSGNGGGDILRGGGGDDTISGGAGRDALIGNAGNDLLTGGADRDIFYYFGPDSGADRITDFIIGQDLIGLDNTGTGFAGLTFSTAADGAGIVSFGTTSIEFDGVSAADLNQMSVFHFY